MYVTLGSMRVQGRLNAQKGDLIPLWLFVLEAVPRGKQACRSDPRPRSCPADNLSRYAVAEATNRVADRVGLEVNPYLVTVGEWRYPIPNSFVADVKVGSLVPVLLHSDCRHG